MNDKPTIVLVHGFWGGARTGARSSSSFRGRAIPRLRAVELPLTSLADDARRTRKMVAQQSGSASEDRMINPENQKKMSSRMNPRKTITLAASHSSLA